MKFKLDENIGRRGVDLLEASGHDVVTVYDQDLSGATDDQLFAVCCAEKRALITLDRDFRHVRRFPPEESAGIVVLDVGPRVTLRERVARCRRTRTHIHCGIKRPAYRHK